MEGQGKGMHLTWAVIHKFDSSCLDFSCKFARGGSGDASDWQFMEGSGDALFFGGKWFL